jgi:hypothetical protein
VLELKLQKQYARAVDMWVRAKFSLVAASQGLATAVLRCEVPAVEGRKRTVAGKNHRILS